MKDMLLMHARYAKKANASVLALLDGLSNEAREEDRKSYYGSLSGLARHVLGGTLYMQSLFRASMPKAAAVLKPTEGITVPEGKLSPQGWSELFSHFACADQTTIDLIQSLDNKDLHCPVRLDWYDGKPETVPFHFLANQMLVHGTHHRGQISQILDELGIEHDFSGIDLEFLGAK